MDQLLGKKKETKITFIQSGNISQTVNGEALTQTHTPFVSLGLLTRSLTVQEHASFTANTTLECFVRAGQKSSNIHLFYLSIRSFFCFSFY